MQEMRSAIKSLHDDSRRKLNHDYEIHGALESLFSQMQTVREGLATLSETFMEETGKQHHRISQVLRWEAYTCLVMPCMHACQWWHSCCMSDASIS